MPLTRMAMAGLTVLVGCGGASTTPEFKNTPLRVISGMATPAARESTLQIGNCALAEKFSVLVDDPDISDIVRAKWFIDPDEHYTGGTPGNPGAVLSDSATIRDVRAPTAFMDRLSTLADGRKHRVEVVVTDGDFLEDSFTDPVTMQQKPFLRVVRPSLVTDAGVVQVEAYRDEYLWLVEVKPCP